MLAALLPSFPVFLAAAPLPDDEMRQVEDAIEENIPEPALRPYFTRLLVAIRKAENGGPGRQFGVLHPKAKTYRQQAGWCSAIAWKRYEEWTELQNAPPYLVYLANRYAPTKNATNDPLLLNLHWLKNVRAFMGGPKDTWEPPRQNLES